jgi:hypothetical protein
MKGKDLMIKLTMIGMVCIGLLMLGSPVTFAQVPTHIEYDFSGYGNFLVSPVHYSGSIDAGEPLLVGGYWDMWVDDTGWPPDSDKLVRWTYIDSTYFAPHYDLALFTWTGVFDEYSTASSPTWDAGHTAGQLSGTATLKVTISDFDFDQVIDPDERAFSVFSGIQIVVNEGTGIWAGYCGQGSFSGYSMNPDPINWADDYVEGHTSLDIEPCDVPTNDITWGQVKQLYQE